MTIHDDLKRKELELVRVTQRIGAATGSLLRDLRARYAQLEGEIDELKEMLGEDES